MKNTGNIITTNSNILMNINSTNSNTNSNTHIREKIVLLLNAGRHFGIRYIFSSRIWIEIDNDDNDKYKIIT